MRVRDVPGAAPLSGADALALGPAVYGVITTGHRIVVAVPSGSGSGERRFHGRKGQVSLVTFADYLEAAEGEGACDELLQRLNFSMEK